MERYISYVARFRAC